MEHSFRENPSSITTIGISDTILSMLVEGDMIGVVLTFLSSVTAILYVSI